LNENRFKGYNQGDQGKRWIKITQNRTEIPKPKLVKSVQVCEFYNEKQFAHFHKHNVKMCENVKIIESNKNADQG